MRFRNKFGMTSMRSFFWLPPAERSAFDRIGLIAVQTVPCGLRCALCSGRSECASLSKNICFFGFISLQSSLQVRDSLWCLKNISLINIHLRWSARYKPIYRSNKGVCVSAVFQLHRLEFFSWRYFSNWSQFDRIS